MPQSYNALWVHLVWSTKNREPVLTKSFKPEVFAVIKEIASRNEIYLDCINGVEDHIHLLVRLHTTQTVANIVKIIKGNSWDFFKNIPEKYITWQDGFGAFSVSPGQLTHVRSYIYNQEKHHRSKSFIEELREINQIAKSGK